MSNEKHVLGLSGGKDSAALAIYMRQNHPELDIDYFFTDTGKELPEVYEYLGKLEGFLGKPILRLNPNRDFDYWLKQYNNFLPSAQTRWCTRQMKLKPFEDWVKPMLKEGKIIHSYVAIRSDEPYREGYNATQEKLKIHLPFREDGIDKPAVAEILENSGLGWPTYYEWRSRSGCTFCFYQQKIEWVGLLERHPEAFQEAMSYEKNSLDHGSPFTWTEGEPLTELMKPERIEQIKADHEKRVARIQSRKAINPLRPEKETIDIDDVYGQAKYCVTCHK
ncbi:3'-phosphoadenosine 5'-phosphosulfate sulfotransferase (PAPS reductase)/FAD synthetase [Marinospirillum celere]|uniref:3'-phosphoadenosine 5'-phosphosulfate sulfotransferase (PAPS reductase)/FAD synthetase n=1 Tax=Marinospirillum celere TaxID=1122252 RepID=A0A1I1EIX4_9GAMM|nr:phosphoadenosine phosphosulfate reductase family protein [Marinospirillum celere]SFB87089.1 3'-phosphoadenosine 5'-phosphosulfate sulfotransferase (PAPS reductase)/FAD synthetase [Marinospirillum celere]